MRQPLCQQHPEGILGRMKHETVRTDAKKHAKSSAKEQRQANAREARGQKNADALRSSGKEIGKTLVRTIEKPFRDGTKEEKIARTALKLVLGYVHGPLFKRGHRRAADEITAVIRFIDAR